jgi:hypothetical protein
LRTVLRRFQNRCSQNYSHTNSSWSSLGIVRASPGAGKAHGDRLAVDVQLRAVRHLPCERAQASNFKHMVPRGYIAPVWKRRFYPEWRLRSLFRHVRVV